MIWLEIGLIGFCILYPLFILAVSYVHSLPVNCVLGFHPFTSITEGTPGMVLTDDGKRVKSVRTFWRHCGYCEYCEKDEVRVE